MVRCSRQFWIYILLCMLNTTTVWILYRTFTATTETARERSAEASRLSLLDERAVLSAARSTLAQLDYSQHVANVSKYYSEHRDFISSRNADRLLCSTFIQLTSDKLERTLHNIVQSGNQCDWIIIVYDVDPALRNELVHEFERRVDEVKSTFHSLKAQQSFLRRTQQFRVTIDVKLEFALTRDKIVGHISELCAAVFTPGASELCGLPGLRPPINSDTAYNTLVYPKVLQFLSLFPYLRRYSHVWLLDDDLTLSSFDLKAFLNIWKCTTGTPPIVSQPLIAESTQTYNFLNSDKWAYSRVQSSTVGFIEIQAPVVNSLFLEWFLLSFVMPLARQSHILGADWGFDALFCKSAEYFTTHVLSPADTTKTPHPCLLVIGSPPVHHSNSKVTNSLLGLEVKQRLNGELMAMVLERFAEFFQEGKGPLADPLAVGAKFQSYYQLSGCGEHETMTSSL